MSEGIINIYPIQNNLSKTKWVVKIKRLGIVLIQREKKQRREHQPSAEVVEVDKFLEKREREKK